MKDKCILVGVSGGIAAYKICSLVSSLKKKGNEVHVLMTESAQQFVSPLTMQTLSGNKVVTDMFSYDYIPDVKHVSLAKKADLFVIAPATANIIAKVAHGIADDMLTTTFLAASCPKLIVPAMNTGMLENPITQDNLKICASYGMHIIDSEQGYLACGDTGKGRMVEPEVIEDAIEAFIEKKRFLKSKKIVITAGATRQEIDPVRYITNHSTGKMGYALAKQARNFGAKVTLISGKTNLPIPYGVNFVEVISASDMAKEVKKHKKGAHAIIMSAAVSDYTPKNKAKEKIKKGKDLNLELKRTEDILLSLGKTKTKGQVLIGFAMESENLIENAKKKLKEKNVDYIVANSIKEEGAGFGYDTNHVTILSAKENLDLGLLSKEETAERILKTCLKKGK